MGQRLELNQPCRIGKRLVQRCFSIAAAWMIALILLNTNWTAAQDVFGGADNTNDSEVFSQDATTTPKSNVGQIDASSNFKIDPLVRRVREKPPQDPTSMGKAISAMVQMRSWSDVGSLLDQVATKKWGTKALAEISRSIEPTVWSLLRNSEGKLTEAQTKTLRSVYAAPTALAREPAVIDSNIDQLASDNANFRQVAELRLQDGQLTALKRLLERLLAGDDKVSGARLAAAMIRFDRDGIDALRAACCVEDPARKSQVLLAIAELPGTHFSIELAAAIYSDRISPELRAAMVSKIQKNFSRIPDLNSVSNLLAQTYQASLDDYQRHRGKSTTLVNTCWQSTSQGVITRDASREIALLERLTQIACWRSELQQTSPSTIATATAIQLQRAYHNKPTLRDAEVEKSLVSALPESLASEPSFWIECYQQASKLQMHGAAVRALQGMQQRIAAGKLLAPMEFLSQQLSDKRPVIRYLAMQAIESADPKTDYAGSVQAISTAVEMASLSQGPQALVIGGSLELCMSADELIQRHTQTVSVIANSAREAYLALSKQNPIEMILIVDRVHDQRLYEMLQRLRASNSLPIAVLIDGLSPSESELINRSSGVQSSVLSRNPEHMKIILDQMIQSLDVRPMNLEDRADLIETGTKFLIKISSDRNAYSFYPVTDWHQQLVSVRQSMAPSNQSQILSGLGTRESQIQLLSLAGQNGAKELDRIAAGKAFGRSVKQFGLQLEDRDVKSAYATYNQLGPNDPIIAKVLGYCLDAIEAQAGARAWPDPL